MSSSGRAAGRRIDDEVLAHISPAHSESINFFGAIEVDLEGELAPARPHRLPAPAGARHLVLATRTSLLNCSSAR